MLDIHETTDAAVALRLGDDMQTDRRLTGTPPGVNLNDTPPRHAADTQCDVKAQTAVGMVSTLTRVASPSFDDAIAKTLIDARLSRVATVCAHQ